MSARRSWLVEPIREGWGEANVGDTLWPVRGADLAAGARVVVVGERDGALRVSRPSRRLDPPFPEP
jgi:membrane protein implicated in regulation of membrane protease activity